MRYHTFLSKEEIKRIIETPEGWCAGWELNAYAETLIWSYAVVEKDSEGKIARCRKARDATAQEAKLLSHLLKGDLVCRCEPVYSSDTGNRWAFACLE